NLFLEDYRSRIRGSEAYHPSGVEIYNFVVVYFNDAGETSQLVMNHRPQSAALLFSSLLTEHFGDAFDPGLFYGGDVRAHLLDRDLSRGLWPPSSRGPAAVPESHTSSLGEGLVDIGTVLVEGRQGCATSAFTA